ncbi:hypothetical protein WJX75_004896 [Coccomyxa subellipsoidea]|uniref:Oxysterol-binding protein n=1 Tax=Coccomyxa subellipsoidea TaxID=248742 RepID=A0ABR2YGJ3_9CHLO
MSLKSGGRVINAEARSARLPDPAWMLDLDEPFMKRRDRLPEPAQEPKSISVWELIKEFVGKDLARITDLSLPVALCEPVTDMQRRGDFLEYTELLHEAAELPKGSMERLLKVTAFAVSIYSCVYRPFAPCRSPKGETFELVSPDKGIRAIGEKCGECPGVNAFLCEGRGWVLSCDEMNKMEFRGQYANIRPTGLIRIDFHDGEEFRWNPLLTIVQHIILGTHYLDHNGTLHIQTSAASHASRVRFKEPFLAFSNKQVHQVKGHVEVGGQKLEHPLLHGKWDGALWATHTDGSQQLLWQKNAPHEHPSRFGFSRWALSLNDMPEGLERLLPPSDMRWRHDVRLLEQGKYDEAEGERKRLLKRVASAREAATRPFEPRWFQLHPEVKFGEGRRYTYKGGYFEARSSVKNGTGRWEGCPDLFGTGEDGAGVYP